MDDFNEVFQICNDGNPNEMDITTDDESEMKSVKTEEIYKVLTIAQIEEMMNEYINDVKSIVSMPDSNIRILLNHMGWEKSELLIRLTAENRDEFIAEVNIANPFVQDENPIPQQQNPQNTECAYCLWDMDQRDPIGLRCAHECCTECYREYLTDEIRDEYTTEMIYCPAKDCHQIVDSDFVMRVITDEDVQLKYRYLMANSFVQSNHMLRWCPLPDCPTVIQVNPMLKLDYRQNCQCTCGHQFCFNCSEECHDPLPCDLISKWKEIDYENVLRFTWNTKNCPKCGVLIENDGDSNRMECDICELQFCWACCGKWDNEEMHDDCSDGAGLTDDDKAYEERYRNYLMCYKSNKTSLEFEKKLLDSDMIKAKIREPGDFCKLKEALEVLCDSRKQLMLSYIFAYFVKPHPQEEIFEMNRNDLQSAVEKLTMYLNQDVTNDYAMDDAQKVYHNARYCKGRQKKLEEHICEGFEENWWLFESEP